MTPEKKQKMKSELQSVINRNSFENESNTPDWMLAEYLMDCLEAHTNATRRRDNWYGGKQSILDSEKKETWSV